MKYGIQHSITKEDFSENWVKYWNVWPLFSPRYNYIPKTINRAEKSPFLFLSFRTSQIVLFPRYHGKLAVTPISQLNVSITSNYVSQKLRVPRRTVCLAFSHYIFKNRRVSCNYRAYLLQLRSIPTSACSTLLITTFNMSAPRAHNFKRRVKNFRKLQTK